MRKPILLRKGIYWVGAVDWNLRSFHGYSTPRGSTYNAYLVVDDKITLIDTVKEPFADEMLERISAVIDPSRIDILISNHVEMDHSGAIGRIADLNPDVEIYSSVAGARGLAAHFDSSGWNLKTVKSGDSLNLGGKNLTFYQTPMVHWPDNMVEYMPEEKILFSNDSFGQHFANSLVVDRGYPRDIVLDEAKKYYGNIVLPYSPQVRKELEAVSGLPIGMIAPSHGVVWEKYLQEIIGRYEDWSAGCTVGKAVIVYDTMWGSTEKMAKALVSLFSEEDLEVRLFRLEDSHVSDVMTDVVDADFVCVGSPTLNNRMTAGTAGFLEYLTGLAPKGRKALSFGSYGWGGQSIPLIAKALAEAGFEVLDEKKINYRPSPGQLEEWLEEVRKKIR